MITSFAGARVPRVLRTATAANLCHILLLLPLITCHFPNPSVPSFG